MHRARKTTRRPRTAPMRQDLTARRRRSHPAASRALTRRQQRSQLLFERGKRRDVCISILGDALAIEEIRRIKRCNAVVADQLLRSHHMRPVPTVLLFEISQIGHRITAGIGVDRDEPHLLAVLFVQLCEGVRFLFAGGTPRNHEGQERRLLNEVQRDSITRNGLQREVWRPLANAQPCWCSPGLLRSSRGVCPPLPASVAASSDAWVVASPEDEGDNSVPRPRQPAIPTSVPLPSVPRSRRRDNR